MRPRVAYHRDTLNTRRLPSDETYLDYRTKINPVPFDNQTTLRLIFVASVLLVPLAVTGRLISFVGDWLPLFIGGLAIVFIVVGGTSAAFLGKANVQLAWGGALLIVTLVAFFMQSFNDPRDAYLWLMAPALMLAAGLALFAGKQASFWMTANHEVGQQSMFRWRRLWSFSGEPEDQRLCPELLTIPIVLISVPMGLLAGFGVLHLLTKNVPHFVAGTAALMTVFGVMLVAWIGAHQFLLGVMPPVVATPIAAWRTLRVFITYNRHDTPAAGVFRFPTKILRSVFVRDFLFATSLALMSLALVALLLPPPAPVSWREIWRVPERRPIELADHEWDRFRSLPYHQARDFMNRLTAEKKAAILAQVERANQDRRRNSRMPPILAALVAGTLGPPIFLLAITGLITGSTVHRFYKAFEEEGAPLHSGLTPWQTLVDRVLNSPNTTEARHYFLGSSLYHDYPILLDEQILTDHGHVLGDTGAYKTSMSIAPLATQMIAKGRSVLMIDLKGEPALFQGLRQEAARAGLPFKWFTTTPYRSSYVFNPLLQKNWRKFTSNQRVQIVLSALSLDYGFDYGRAFYTAMNETVLSNLVRKAPMESFDDLYQLLSQRDLYRAFGDILDWEKARHLVALVNRLRTVYPLNLKPRTLPNRPEVFQNAIELSDLLYEPQVVYFYLKTPTEPLSTAGVAKLAIYSLFTAAAEDESTRKNRTFVLIDEFQQLISNSVERVLETGRSLGTSFILSHQTKGQTKRGGVDIQETVESCTAYKHNYRASDLRSIMELEQLSGQGMFHRFSWSQPAPLSDDDEEEVTYTNSIDGSVNVMETTGPLLERNLVMELSADPNGSIVRFTKDSGYTRFGGKATPMLSNFHITESEFQERAETVFPEPNADTVVVEPDLGETVDITPREPGAAKNPAMEKRMPLLLDGADPDEKMAGLL